MNLPIQVLIVDDSAFFRYTVTKYLAEDPDITVIGNASDGFDALDKLIALKPDVIILDVEMPRLDGLATLKQIMVQHPTPVIMLSASTQPGARTTIQALMRGAVDFVPKPHTTLNIDTVIDELINKIKTAAGAQTATRRLVPSTKLLKLASGAPKSAPGNPQLFQKGDPLIIIGTSTGGPQALQQILVDLPADLPAAILVVQHMPAGFTHSLAQRLHDISPLIVQEAANGDRLARGVALLAPGDFHLRLQGIRQVALDQGPRRQHVRPAIDVTMESAVAYHGSSIIGVVLTGMGQDGTEGAGQIKAAGGRIIAEAEATSVVYGMPASVIKAGLADQVAPLPEIASILLQLIDYGRDRI